MQTLNPQAQKILAILRNGFWHCPIDWGYADGHGKRLTDIKRFVVHEGLKLEWDWCDCGRHTAKLKKRRLVPIQESQILKEFHEEFKNRTQFQTQQAIF